MKSIPLTQGKVAMVSDHRYAYLNQWKWQARRGRDGKWYAGRNLKHQEHGRRITTTIYMHRFITNAPAGYEVDHRDGDGLNNVDENLRVCNRPQNSFNNVMRRDNQSGFKGVCLDKRTGTWRARITFQGHRTYVGFFDDPEDAARAYDKKAMELFGEFAKTNF